MALILKECMGLSWKKRNKSKMEYSDVKNAKYFIFSDILKN